MAEPIPELDPQALAAALAADPELVLLDVRTVAEFCRGRPSGRAANVPWEFHAPSGQSAPLPNAAFVAVVEAAFGHGRPLAVACQGGERAPAAAARLVAAGFERIAILAGGYAAWIAAGLPRSTDNRPGVSYVSLLTRMRRPGEAGQAPSGH